jgi:hypothetical protein
MHGATPHTSHTTRHHRITPRHANRAQVPGCGDGVTCHVRTFLHACGRLTMSIATLPAAEALPGEDRGQVWTWLRPKGASEQQHAAVRRCACLPVCVRTLGWRLPVCVFAGLASACVGARARAVSACCV